MDESDNPEECKVCISNYDKAKRRPRTLPCGHTFCSSCIDGMIKGDILACPTCRVQHQTKSSTQFPISYDMEAIIRKLKILQITHPPSKQNEGAIQECETNLNILINRIHDTISQLNQYDTQLESWKREHTDIIERLQALETRNNLSLKQLNDERSILLYQRQRGKDSLKRLEKIKVCLGTAGSAEETVSALDECETNCSNVEDWLQHCIAIFPDQTTLQNSLKVRDTSKKLLDGDVVEKESEQQDSQQQESEQQESRQHESQHESEQQNTQTSTSTTIMEKVHNITPILSVDGIGNLEGNFECLVKSGRVVASIERQNIQCHGRITMYRGRTHLHVIKNIPPPQGTHVLQHNDLLASLDPNNTLVFLELGWTEGESEGRGKRVYIRLSPSTELAQNFRLLCTGETGHSYLNSRVLGVWNKGTEFEVIGGGDYERGDGQGGMLLSTGELKQRQEYQRIATAGTVRAMHGAAVSRGSQFSISTRDSPNREWHWAFGQVESGLEVVRAVAAYKRIKEVRILDCGIVLPI